MSFMMPSKARRRASALRKLANLNRPANDKVRFVYDRDWIRALIIQGYSNTEVAKLVGCSTQPVQKVRAEYRREQHAKNPPAEAPKQKVGIPSGVRRDDGSARYSNYEQKFFSGLRR